MNAIVVSRADIRASLDSFIDIHAHILPGLDDGPKNMAESVAMAREYAKAGINTVVATPHFLPGTAWASTQERVLEGVRVLMDELLRQGIALRVLPGMEIAHHRKLEERIFAGNVLPLGNSDYFLVEPSFQGEQEGMLESLGSLIKKGVKIVLAHPERAETWQKSPQLLKRFVDQGLKIQANSGSLLGYFGEKSRKTAEMLLRENCIHFVASDAHDHARRAPLRAQEWQRLLAIEGGNKLMSACNALTEQTFRAAQA